MSKLKSLFLNASLVVLITGCVSPMQRPTSVAPSQRHIYPVSYLPALANMPMGSIAADNGQLIYRKWSSGAAATTGLMFGAIGALIANQSMKSDTRTGNRYLATLSSIDMRAETTAVLQGMDSLGKLENLQLINSQAATGRGFQLQPFLFLAVDNSGGGELLVILRVVERSGAEELWSGQYIGFIALDHQNSDLTALPEKVHQALISTLTFFLSDMRGELKVDVNEVVVTSSLDFVFTSNHLGYRVTPEIDGLVAFQAGGSLSGPYAGMQIHPAGSLSYADH